jgi:PAS domain S-box-containing protein
MTEDKILIVINEPVFLKELEKGLKDSRYSVFSSNPNSEEAHSLAIKTNPDLIVISTNLESNYSGIDAALKIKKQIKVPIIFLSFIEDKVAYKKTKQLSPIAYLSPPFTVDNLLHTIELGLANNKLQKEIIDAHNKYRTLITAAKAGVYEIDPVNFEIDGDKSLAQVFGYTKTEVKEKGWRNLLPIEDYKKKKEVLSNLLQGKIDSYSLELRVIKKNGELAWVLSSGSLLTDSHGKVKIVGSLTDITERKLDEVKLKKYSEELKKSSSAKDKFLSIISHDLRNPFNSLLGFSELLANNVDELTELEVKDSANTLHKTATHLYNLLTNLLDWSRLQLGTFAFEKTEFSVGGILNHVLSIFTDSFNAKNLELIKETECKLNVIADQNMIETAIRNIVSNAIKFTKPGGTIKVGCRANDDNVDIFVTDDGVGIDKEDQARLFNIEKLYSSEGTNYEKGTGFGLLLCKEFAEKNGGTIKFKSEKDKGSTFIISLPSII